MFLAHFEKGDTPSQPGCQRYCGDLSISTRLSPLQYKSSHLTPAADFRQNVSPPFQEISTPPPPTYPPATPNFLKSTNDIYSRLVPLMRTSAPCPLLVEQDKSDKYRLSYLLDVHRRRELSVVCP